MSCETLVKLLRKKSLPSFVADPRLTKQRMFTSFARILSRYLPFDALIISQAAYKRALSALMAFATPLEALLWSEPMVEGAQSSLTTAEFTASGNANAQGNRLESHSVLF